MSRLNKSTASDWEKKALRLTSHGSLFMAILGLGFALVSKSEVILFDGFISFIGFGITLLTQKVSRLVLRPGDQQYPFGYATFEPMLNLSKGLLIGIISLFAMISAITALFTGGRSIPADLAALYALIGGIVSFWVAWCVGGLAKRSRSSIARVDARNWMIDGVISIAIAITFLVVELTKGTPLEAWAPYADPLIVIVLVVLLIPIPIQIVHDAWRQIMGYRPDSKKMKAIHAASAKVFNSADNVTCKIRSLEIGRLIYVQVYIVDPDDWSQNLAQQDILRHRLYSELVGTFEIMQLDLIFTKQNEWTNGCYELD